MRISEIAQFNYFKSAYNIKNATTPFGTQNKRVMTPEDIEEYNDLRVFTHHIYEYKKGLRHLILTTEKAKHREAIERNVICL